MRNSFVFTEGGFLNRNRRINEAVVDTKGQEQGLCNVFNAYSDGIFTEIDDDNIIKVLGGEDYKLKKNWQKWATSYVETMKLLDKHLKGRNKLSEFKMVRMGDDDDVIKSYKELIDVYRKVYKETLAHIDPTDVLLYKKDEASNIVNKFNEWKSTINVKSLKKEISSEDFEAAVNIKKNLVLNYCKEDGSYKPLWDCDFISLSLKQLERNYIHSIDRYNMFDKNSENVINIGNIKKTLIKDGDEITHRTKRGVTVTIRGVYNFDYGVGEEKEGKTGVFDTDVSNIRLAEEKIKLVMRSGSTSGETNSLDLLLAHGPTLGKCSKELWVKLLGLRREKNKDETKDLKLCLDKFEEKVKKWYSKGETKPFIQIIKSCCKNTEICVPFVLIH